MHALKADTANQTLHHGHHRWPMAIGAGGACPAGLKREGDGATPYGRYLCEAIFYRADRLSLPPCPLPAHAISADLGWCDAPDHKAYNRLIHQPFDASHETLWRDDNLYDALIVLSHNRWPAVPGYGSAIFLHIARETGDGLAPTRGCLALRKDDYVEMLRYLPPHAEIVIS